MSGEDTSTSRNYNAVPYDYGDKKSLNLRLPLQAMVEEQVNLYTKPKGMDFNSRSSRAE